MRWRASPLFRVDTVDFPSGGALRTGIVFGFNEWNRNPQNLTLRHSFAGIPSTSFTDTRSDVIANDATCGIGCATIFQSCSKGIIAADIEFQTTQNWSSADDAPYFAYLNTTVVDARITALHELGHAIGIGHTNDAYSLMGDGQRMAHMNGGTELGVFTHPYVGTDTTRAALALYGAKGGARAELGVSHWMFFRNGGDISRHRFSRVFQGGTGAPVPTRGAFFGFCPQDTQGNSQFVCMYDVNRGQVVDVEFMHENTGAVAATQVKVVLKLSADNQIGGDDITLSTVFLDYGLVGPQRRRHQVTIPTGIARNRRYFLGIITDVDNRVPEIQEDPFNNNAPPPFTGNAAWVPVFVL